MPGPREWFEVVEVVKPYVVSINTPQGSGTGFLLSYGESSGICAIATAAHVVQHSDTWEQPIRLSHLASNSHRLLRFSDRAIRINYLHDTAAILFDKKDFPLPTKTLELVPKGKWLKEGNHVGWLGFPAISINDLCFFSGMISAYRSQHGQYLVDGVSVNGVSGGPAFTILGDQIAIVGVVSAYIPNRATGESLPGLMVVQDVSHFHEIAEEISTIEEARAVRASPRLILTGALSDDLSARGNIIRPPKVGEHCEVDICVAGADGYVTVGGEFHFLDEGGQFTSNFSIGEFSGPEEIIMLGQSQEREFALGALSGIQINGTTRLGTLTLIAKRDVPEGATIQFTSDSTIALGIQLTNVEQLVPDLSQARILFQSRES